MKISISKATYLNTFDIFSANFDYSLTVLHGVMAKALS